jgi:LPXTG-motif cell wall-anchored protein
VTGRYTSSTIWFVLSGLVASVSGAALILQGRWRS